MRLSSLFAFAALCLPATAAFATPAPITYNVDIVYGNVSAIGTITTDGTLGVLGNFDFTAFNIVLTEGSATDDITYDSSVNLYTNHVGLVGDSTTATATGLYFDFSGAGAILDFENHPNGTDSFLCLQSSGGEGACEVANPTLGYEDIGAYSPDVNDPGVINQESGVQLIASAASIDMPPIAATPEPSSLILLTTGILGAAGAARRRFRRN